MNGLETLKTKDIQEISQKTFIPIEEIRAILNRDFDLFNRAKAAGFIHILEREYDLDLSKWLEEYNSHHGEKKGSNEEIFILADNEHEPARRQRFYLLLGVVIVLCIIAFFTVLNNKENPAYMVDESELIEKATNSIEESQQPREEVLAPETPAETTLQTPLPPIKQREFIIESDVNLWVGITYLDNNENMNKIFKGTFELDPDRDQIIEMGHGQFTILFDGEEIVPKNRGRKQKYEYKGGLLTALKVPAPKPRPVETAVEKEESQTLNPGDGSSADESNKAGTDASQSAPSVPEGEIPPE